MSEPEPNLKVYKAIVDFITSLAEEFEDRFHSLRLYNHFIKKIEDTHHKAINKNIAIFEEFCRLNNDAIINKDTSLLTTDKIQYSDKVGINVRKIFELASDADAEIIWKHLIYISALTNPEESKTRKILEESSKDKESQFIQNIISKVEHSVKPSGNPLEAVQNIMESGVFNELIGEMNDSLESGDINLSKLLGSVKGLVNNAEDNNPGTGSAFAEITSLLENLTNSVEKGEDTNLEETFSPLLSKINGDLSSDKNSDMSKLMSSFLGMINTNGVENGPSVQTPNPLTILSTLMKDNKNISDKIDAEYEAMKLNTIEEDDIE